MEIRDKLNARQIALQMATEMMVAIIPRLSDKTGYEVDTHIGLAKSFYGWLVGGAELPEVYNPESSVEKLMNVFQKTQNNSSRAPLWLSIIPINDEVPPFIVDLIRKNLPVYLRAKDGNTKVVGSVEELNEIIESGTISDYTGYAPIPDTDPNHPMRKEMGISL